MSSEVPDGWKATTLAAACEFFTDGDWVESKDQNPDGEVRLIQLADIGDGLFQDKSSRFLTAEKARELRCSMLETNDLLIARMADPIARCCLFPGLGQPAATVVDVAIARAREGVDQRFLSYAVSNRPFRELALGAASGTTRSRISRSNLGALPILLPHLDEQRRIAEVLRSVDETISRLRQTCEAYERLRLAEVENFAHASLGGDAQPLASLITSMDSGWSPDCDGEPASGDEWGVLKTSAVTWEGFDDRQNKRLPDALNPRPVLAVARDDILITRAGPAERTGVVAIVRATEGRRMLSDKLIRLRARDDLIEPLALAELLRSEVVQDQLRALKSGMAASQTNISQKTLRGVSIPTPSRETQLAFVTRITNLDAALDAERQALLTARRLQQCISGDLLSGRVRVPA